jgi:2-isopropylmalate synthase
MTPESVGVPTSELILGKHSGRHALTLRYEELGYVLNAAELDAAYHRFTDLADRKKRVYDQDLISLLVAETPVSPGVTIVDEKPWARTVAA